MYINDYKSFITKSFVNSNQFAEINNILNKYRLQTLYTDWLNISVKKYSITNIITINFNLDILDNYYNLLYDKKDELKICDLVHSFAKEIFNIIAKECCYFTKVNDNVYMEITSNYGIITLTSGDDGDYIYLMNTDF